MLPGPWPGRSWRGVSWGQGVVGGARGPERTPLWAGPAPTLPAAAWPCPMHTRETVDTKILRSRIPDLARPFTAGPGLLVFPEGPWSGQRGLGTWGPGMGPALPQGACPPPVPTSWTWAGGRARVAVPVCPRGLPPDPRVTLSPCDSGVSIAHVPFCPLSWTWAEKQHRPGPGSAEKGAARVPEGETSGATRGSRPRVVLWGPHGGPGQTGGLEVVERCGEPLTWWWLAVPESLSQEGWGSEVRGSFQPEPSDGGQGVNHTAAGSLVPWWGVSHTAAGSVVWGWTAQLLGPWSAGWTTLAQ